MRFILLFTLFVSTSLFAQKSRAIAFYNVENLFDTIDGTNDDAEFLPKGRMEWITKRYNEKLSHIREVLTSMNYPMVCGFSEIENGEVIKDIINKQKAFKNYAVVHYNSLDARGVDVAMIYDKSQLKLVKSGYIRYVLPGDTTPTSRDIVWAKYKINNENLFVMVNHWPSRRGGNEVSEPRRIKAAESAKAFIDSVMTVDPNSKIVLMGDLNDHPEDKAPQIIATKLTPMITKASGEFGGSYNYKEQWEIIDHIFVSPGFQNADTVKVIPNSGKINSFPYLITEYKGVKVPFRTYAGPKFLGGYSDHLPVSIEVSIP